MKMKEKDIIELDFITRINKAMEEKGMTATALARKANVSHTGVFRVLSGVVGLSFERAWQLADALDLEFYPMLRPKSATGARPTASATGAIPTRSPDPESAS